MSITRLATMTLSYLCLMGSTYAGLKDNPYSTKIADAATKTEDWSAAEAELERIIGSIRATPMNLNGFGVIYFKKGWSEYKQEKWKEAIESFKICYNSYPSKANDKNPFHKEALRWWADAAYMTKDYETSARIFRKYLAEK